jgi:hypothetical protein
MVKLYLHFLICHHDLVLNYLSTGTALPYLSQKKIGAFHTRRHMSEFRAVMTSETNFWLPYYHCDSYTCDTFKPIFLILKKIKRGL